MVMRALVFVAFAGTAAACGAWGTCNKDPSCCPDGYGCYESNKYYAQCRKSCDQSGWTCKLLGGSGSGSKKKSSSSKKTKKKKKSTKKAKESPTNSNEESSNDSGSSSPPASSSSSGGCESRLEGWAAQNGGTTGGGNGKKVYVSSASELKNAAKKSGVVIVIKGTINAGSSPIELKSDTTLMGADKNAKLKGGINMKRVKNVILKNFWIDVKGSFVDGVACRQCSNIWLDHMTVSDASDGLVDLTKQTSYVTVSYCKFYYTDSGNQHRLASLVGGGGGSQPNDWGKNKATYHHNHWGRLVRSRQPRIMYGTSHVYNSFYNAVGNNYCIGVGSYAAVLVENNYFKSVKHPHKFMYDWYAHITARGNKYDGTTGNKDSGKFGSKHAPGQHYSVQPFSKAPYSYNLQTASAARSTVEKCAGPV